MGHSVTSAWHSRKCASCRIADVSLPVVLQLLFSVSHGNFKLSKTKLHLNCFKTSFHGGSPLMCVGGLRWSRNGFEFWTIEAT
jgi:hypothetical protein